MSPHDSTTFAGSMDSRSSSNSCRPAAAEAEAANDNDDNDVLHRERQQQQHQEEQEQGMTMTRSKNNSNNKEDDHHSSRHHHADIRRSQAMEDEGDGDDGRNGGGDAYMEDSQETQSQRGTVLEWTQLTQTYGDTQLTPLDETSNFLSSQQTQSSPHSISHGHSPPPPPVPWGRIVPCNLTGNFQPTSAISNSTPTRMGGSSTGAGSRNINIQQSATPPIISPMDFVSDQDEYTIGRSSKCDVTASGVSIETNTSLSEKDQKIFAWGHSLISNRHCKIFIDRAAMNNHHQRQQQHGGGKGGFFNHNHGRIGAGCSSTAPNNDSPVYIEDMSGNGTIINQQTLLRKGEKRQLHSGDEILLIDPNILRKRVKSERMIQVVLSAYSFTFIQPKQHRRPCVDPRAMNYTRQMNNNNNQYYRHFGGLSEGGTAASTTTIAAPTAGQRGIGGTSCHHFPFRTGNKSKRTLSCFDGSLHLPNPDEGRIELVYDIREVLGDGTSGQVRRCIHRKTGQEFAVKIIGLRRQFDKTIMEREVTLLQSLDHPYIVQLVEVFVKPSEAMYIVMELVKGGDLFEKIADHGKYTETEARQTMRRLLAAVCYLHEDCNIVHRDLKLENLLCSSDVNIKLADFGLAKIVNADGLKTFCGTPAYFAPEVLERRGTITGEGRYGKPADMWSIGVILYILLVGRPPFDADMDDPKTFEFDSDEFDPICEYPVARDLVEHLLRQDPKRRLTIRQACDHPWINIDDGDTHCHPLDDPAVTTKKRLFDEKSSDYQREALEETLDRVDSSNRPDDSDDASARSKDSVMSKEEFSQYASNSHHRTDSICQIDCSTSPSSNNKNGHFHEPNVKSPQSDSESADKPSNSFHEEATNSNTDDEKMVDSNQTNDKNERPCSPSPCDVVKQMSIESNCFKPIESEDRTKFNDKSSDSEDDTTEKNTSDVSPKGQTADSSSPRSPFSKLNLNGRGNQFREQILNSQNKCTRNHSTEDASPVATAGRQSAVTPTSSNVKKQRDHADEDVEVNNGEGEMHEAADGELEYANEVDDPILSQFSSEESSIGSFDDSHTSSSADKVSTNRPAVATSLPAHPVSGDEKKRKQKRHATSEAGDDPKDAGRSVAHRPTKRPRKAEKKAGQTKKKSTQKTLTAFFNHKK